MERTEFMPCTDCTKGKMIYQRPAMINKNNPWRDDPTKHMDETKLAIHKCNKCGRIATLKPLEAK